MKVAVDPDVCISCGLCVNDCPAVFGWDDNDKAHAIVDEVPSHTEGCAKDAIENCPTEAISEVK